jgi:hypothetical protein
MKDASDVFGELMQRVQARSRRGTDPLYEEHPTVIEALAMFKARPDLSAVQTDLGWLSRDGTLVQPSWGERAK